METTATSAPSAEMALNARVIDFTSKVNGRAYRLFVSIPTRRPTPPEGHAVVYLIDGNLHFGIAVDTARIQACWPDVIDPVVVGIGYPTDSVSTALDLRMIDLTTPISEERLKKGFIAKMPRPSEGFGGMDNYFRVIEEEVKPRVEAMVAINRQEQVLMGHSLGGLTTLHALFRHTATFQQFVAISPSIWFNDCAVLAHEAAFSDQVRSGQVKARALISVGGLESTFRFVAGLPAGEQDFRDMTEECRMVPNTTELGDRLAALASPGFHVETVVHEGDDHNMVPPAGIARGVRFAFRR
jgi:predicted alpha/beta superfamily hydrolase